MSDSRFQILRPLTPPAYLLERHPLSVETARFVRATRSQVADVIHGRDDRLVVVAGPCSIHDVDAAREYALRLKAQANLLEDELILVMRVYFEKPRTTVGWKGLINDPHLDGSFAINEGLSLARALLVDLGTLRLPAGCEFLDTLTPQFISDAVAWAAIGARTTESQMHRELASGLSMPVGFKNGTDGNLQIAIDAVRASSHPHHFPSVTKEGRAAIVATPGNPDCHIILRGAQQRPNCDAASVRRAVEALYASKLSESVMVDCSHGNSGKDPSRQAGVAAQLSEQLRDGQNAIKGVMLESNLVPGRQELRADRKPVFGQSITDACLGWDETVPLLEMLAGAVRNRRRARRGQGGAGAPSYRLTEEPA